MCVHCVQIRSSISDFFFFPSFTLSMLDGIWAAFWGMFYRKFFWDFVGGTLRDPGGIQYVITFSV